jgi:excinuclease UvrABC nuclease subunit
VDRAGYAALVEKAKFFLEGHHELLLDWLESEMQKAADRLEY